LIVEMMSWSSAWEVPMRRLVNIIFANMGTKLMALVLAVLTWVLIYNMTVTTTQVEFAVEIVTPPGVEVLGYGGIPTKPGIGYYVRATLSSSQSALEQLTHGKIARHVIEQDVNGKLPITVVSRDLDFDLDPNLTLVEVSPQSFTVVVDKAEPKQLYVKVKTVGDLAPGYRLASEPRAIPSSVTVIGPASVLAERDEIFTQPINLAGRSESFVAENMSLDDEMPLDSAEGVGEARRVKVAAAETVSVQIVIEPETMPVQKTVTFELLQTPAFANKYRVELLPPYDSFEFQVRESLIPGADSLAFRGVVDLTDPTKFPGPGEHIANVQFQLPEGVTYPGPEVEITVTLEARGASPE